AEGWANVHGPHRTRGCAGPAAHAGGPRPPAGLPGTSRALVADDLVRHHRLLATFDRDFLHRAQLEVVLDQLVGVLADEDGDAELLRRGLETRGEVHAVADDRVLHSLFATDVAGDHLARVDADAGLDRPDATRDELRVQRRERLAHADGRTH